jgi:uncharacterized membrane protein
VVPTSGTVAQFGKPPGASADQAGKVTKTMKQLLTFLKATLLGGVIFVLPAWLAVLLVAKGLKQLQVLVKPVSSHLPESVGHPRLLAIILLLALCFIVGLIIQTAIGAQVKRVVEQRVLEKLPGYTTLRGFAAQLSEFEKTTNFQPALIEIEDALVPGFFVEQHTNDRCTVFVPSVPTPMAGAIYIIAASRVHRLDLPAIKVMQCISKWGSGSDALVAALDAKNSTSNRGNKTGDVT